jgi:hypothetical protein
MMRISKALSRIRAMKPKAARLKTNRPGGVAGALAA